MRPARVELFPSPSKGWVQSGNIVTAGRDQAEVMDNIWPSAEGGRLRGGCVEYADCAQAITRLFVYKSGTAETMFASGTNNIYDTAAPLVSVRAGLANGDWSVTQMTTAGGSFLIGANGADPVWYYNGATFTASTITGVTSSTLSQVWSFKERLFFVEKNTLSVWYLPTESVAGAASEINLGSVFRKGGAILFGANWSLDSGEGMDDVCLFVTDQGEIAVYEGTDPSSVSTWSLTGVYEIASPVDKHAFFKAGGDLAILTEDGIVPVSEALRKDRAALQASAITYPIEDAWKDVIANRSGGAVITATLWQAQTLLIVGTGATDGGKNVAFVANSRTGAWARNLGWDVKCSVVFNDALYFVDSGGVVYTADSGGTDNGVQYTGHCVPKFTNSGQYRQAHSVGITYRAPEELDFDLSLHGDYQIDALPIPSPATFASGDEWGTGVWGTFVWGNGTSVYTYRTWQFAGASGYALAPGVSITSNQTAAIPFELLSMRVRFEEGSQL
jgi:hypothetical protein